MLHVLVVVGRTRPRSMFIMKKELRGFLSVSIFIHACDSYSYDAPLGSPSCRQGSAGESFN